MRCSTFFEKRQFTHRTFVRLAILLFALFGLGNFIHGIFMITESNSRWNTLLVHKHKEPSKDTFQSLFLTEGQCRDSFPSLTKEIDDAVARGQFQLEKKPDDYTGLVQGRIKDGKLFVISAEKNPSRDMLYERQAVLHQLHRAIVTSPTPLPDTIFRLSIIDSPHNGGWSFCRSNDPRFHGNYWVMPHFSFWSWHLSFIGPVDQALQKIENVEFNTTWEEKIDKAVWRGTTHFNSVGNIQLRPQLLTLAKGKEWADIESLRWETNAEKADNSLGIEEFCKYKYVIYTEGITYSGRLPFHTACASVIITPPPSYMMHTTHLMRPLFSSTLFSPTAIPSLGRWPKSYEPTSANVIFVDPEWKDLEQTIVWLRSNPEIAKGIAQRQREGVVDAGYLSPAAEVCYWRSLVRGWNSVVKIEEEEWGKWNEEGPENGEGVRWETFSLNSKTRWSD